MIRSVDNSEERPEPLLPYVQQPKGLAYFFGTWSGRIILINSLVYFFYSQQSFSILVPEGSQALIEFGAKDNVLIAQGEVWRLFSSIFLHISFVHFAVNNWALYVLAYQLEFFLKPKWFLLLYLVAGLFGSLASNVFSLSTSAGASGALFGLLGAGLWLERLVAKRLEQLGAQRPRSKIYTGMAVINLGLGFVIPMIDNAAHIGGLLSGIVVTIILLSLRPNRLVTTNKRRARRLIGLLACLFLLGLGLSFSSDFVRRRYEAAISSSEAPLRVYYLAQLLRLDPSDVQARLRRLRLLLLFKQFDEAQKDYEVLQQQGIAYENWQDLIEELSGLAEGAAGALWLQTRLAEDLR